MPKKPPMPSIEEQLAEVERETSSEMVADIKNLYVNDDHEIKKIRVRDFDVFKSVDLLVTCKTLGSPLVVFISYTFRRSGRYEQTLQCGLSSMKELLKWGGRDAK